MYRRRHIALAAISLAVATPVQASRDDWDQASDLARDGLIAAALGIPALKGDWEGGSQAALTMISAVAVTEGLKATIHEDRPDHSDNKSFPSGHTSTSFSAAATLHRRYGWEYGLPAHAVAAFVGVARVKAKKHFVHDVLIGAAIGEGAGWFITQPANDRVRWLPWGDAHGAGATIAYRF